MEQVIDGRRAVNRAIACAIGGFFIWGCSFPLTRYAQGISGPMLLLSIRFLIAFVLLNLMLLFRWEKLALRGKRLKPLLVLGIIEPLCFLFESYGIYYSNATVASVISAASPLAAMGLGILLLREYPTKAQALFCLLPVAGVVLITLTGQELGVVTPKALFFLLVYCALSGLYKVANRAAAAFSPFERTYVLLLSCTVFYTAAAIIETGGSIQAYVAPLQSPGFVLSVLSLGILSSIVSNMLVNWGAGVISATRMAAIGELSPVCGAVLDVLLLHEPFAWPMALGIALVVIGVWQVNRRGA